MILNKEPTPVIAKNTRFMFRYFQNCAPETSIGHSYNIKSVAP